MRIRNAIAGIAMGAMVAGTVTACGTESATNELEANGNSEYIAFAYDHTQETHWEENGLIIGQFSDAVTACRDTRFIPREDTRSCIMGAVEWAEATGQQVNGTYATELPARYI